jgi:hypothetical protein
MPTVIKYDLFCDFATRSLSLSFATYCCNKDKTKKREVTADKTKQQVFADQATGARSEDTSSK